MKCNFLNFAENCDIFVVSDFLKLRKNTHRILVVIACFFLHASFPTNLLNDSKFLITRGNQNLKLFTVYMMWDTLYVNI